MQRETDRYLNMNTTALAYMGDAVYETYVRTHLLDSGLTDANRLHAAAVAYVRADAQAAAVRMMYPELPEAEQALVRRARNRKSGSRPKSTDPVTYKWATAFEALVGYLYLAGKRDRMEEVIGRAIRSAGGANGEKANDQPVSKLAGGLLPDQSGDHEGRR